MTEQLTIGQKIRSIRLSKGMTFRKVAKLAGITHTAIYLIENGFRQPKFCTICKIAAALEVDLNCLNVNGK